MASNNRLYENLRVDLDISPDLEHLMRNNAQLGPLAMKQGLRAITKEGSKQIKSAIKSKGLVLSGRLAKSVRGVTTKNKSFIGTKNWYAGMLERGASPHNIKASKHRGLFFKGLFAKSVHHPGVPAYHFFEDTWQRMESSGQVQSLFAAGVQAAIEAVENGNGG
jgi:phage gpG-like protein